METALSFHPRTNLIENDDLPRAAVENSRVGCRQLLVHALAATDARGHLKFDGPNAHV